MVNYCCVEGCGRNSRLHSHLKYYSIPKEKNRQSQWLKAAGREDLLDKGKEKLTVSHRFCSRHFPAASLKNIHLQDDAVPTLNLPGLASNDDTKTKPEPHKGIVCNNCKNVIYGFRYKCVTCKNFDLCQKCEMQEVHAKHYMLRLPKALKFKLADNLSKKWTKLFNEEHMVPEPHSDSDCEIKVESSSDDDQPINKYVTNYDSGVDLSDDVKTKIRKEVIRALTSIEDDDTDFPKPKNIKPEKKKNERKRHVPEIYKGESKKQKIDIKPTAIDVEIDELLSQPPELAFADVNNMRDVSMDVKSEIHGAEVYPEQAPMMHVKLSDDLTHLTIEMMGEQ